jgi:hypothetical protein
MTYTHTNAKELKTENQVFNDYRNFLSYREQEIWLMRDNGMSYTYIATQFGITNNKARDIFLKAEKKLKTYDGIYKRKLEKIENEKKQNLEFLKRWNEKQENGKLKEAYNYQP